MEELNPVVTLRHPELGSTTSQPLSAARQLMNVGWEPDDAQSAEQLGVKYRGDDKPSEPPPESKTAEEINQERLDKAMKKATRKAQSDEKEEGK